MAQQLGQIVANLLKENKMTQQELSQRSGLSKGTISRIIKGSRGQRASFETLTKLSSGLNVDISIFTNEQLANEQLKSEEFLNNTEIKMYKENIIGKRLEELRLDLGNTMQEEADILNKTYNLQMTKGMISRWESGKADPSTIFLSAYAKYHNIDLNYILGVIDTKKPLDPDAFLEPERKPKKKPADVEKFLDNTEIMFNGETYKLDEKDKEKMRNALEFVFWEAKKNE